MMRPLAEQTIVITGATDGLGRALAGELAAAGAALALHGRDDGKGMATIRDLRQRTGNEKLQWFRADLAALDQVRDLAGRLQSGLDRVDVLVNNAGIGATVPGDGRRMVSRDGYELRFSVNYLSHYLLTRSLLPLLVSSAPARIVNADQDRGGRRRAAGQHHPGGRRSSAERQPPGESGIALTVQAIGTTVALLSTPGGRDSAPPAWGAEGATLPGTSQAKMTARARQLWKAGGLRVGSRLTEGANQRRTWRW